MGVALNSILNSTSNIAKREAVIILIIPGL
jgi:hypothetical protein